MKAKSLIERLEELPEEFGMSFSGLAIFVGPHEKSMLEMRASLLNGKDIYLSRVDYVAKELDLISVIFYRESDGLVEDLGHPHFLYGEEMYNYRGEVFKLYRELLGFYQTNIAQQLGISTRMVANYENGNLPKLHVFEKHTKVLGLIPDYLVQKKQESSTVESKPSS